MEMGIRSKSRTGFAVREVAVRGVAVGLTALGLIIGGQSAALASAGCTAFHGSFVGGALTGSASGTGFSAGDTITLTVTAAGVGDALGLYDATNTTSLIPSYSTAGTKTYTVTAATTDNFIITGNQADPTSYFTWSCAAGSSGGGGTDSQKLTSVQQQGSTVEANTSAGATTGAVSGATDQDLSSQSSDGGSSGSAPPTDTRDILTEDEYADYDTRRLWGTAYSRQPAATIRATLNAAKRFYRQQVSFGNVPVRTSTGVEWQAKALNFAAVPRSPVARGADEAFGALADAGGMPVKAERRIFGFTPQWRVWSSVAGAGYRQSDSSATKGTQINATAGLSYKLRANAVVGVYAGYENFKYDFDTLAGSLKGNGGSIGVYTGVNLTPTLRWKGMVGWTGVSYDGSAGTASGSFTGSRWLFSTSLTGSYRVAAFTVEPSASVFALTERQTGYTDSLSVAHDARDFSSGRVSLGGKVIAPPQMLSRLVVTPYVGLYGDWGFMSDSAVPADISSRGLGAGWAARVTSGVSMPVFARGTLALGGEYGGIGGDYKVWTGTARLSVPF
jgi:hypothetical protein